MTSSSPTCRRRPGRRRRFPARSRTRRNGRCAARSTIRRRSAGGTLDVITTLSYRSKTYQFEIAEPVPRPARLRLVGREPGLDAADNDRWTIGLHAKNITRQAIYHVGLPVPVAESGDRRAAAQRGDRQRHPEPRPGRRRSPPSTAIRARSSLSRRAELLADARAGAGARGRGARRARSSSILLLAYIFNFIDRQIIGVLAVPIKAELGAQRHRSSG